MRDAFSQIPQTTQPTPFLSKVNGEQRNSIVLRAVLPPHQEVAVCVLIAVALHFDHSTHIKYIIINTNIYRVRRASEPYGLKKPLQMPDKHSCLLQASTICTPHDYITARCLSKCAPPASNHCPLMCEQGAHNLRLQTVYMCYIYLI